MKLRSPIQEADYSGVVELINGFESEPVSLEQFKQWIENIAPGRFIRRSVALDEQGRVTGYGVVNRQPWWEAGRYYVWIAVHPGQRRRGIGAALYQDAQSALSEQGALVTDSEVRDDDPASLGFAERRGFKFRRHLYESTLDLDSFDETPFLPALEAVEAGGIQIRSLADFNDSSEARRKLHRVNYLTALDIPGQTAGWMDFETFEKVVCGSSWYRPAGQLMALDGEECIGLSAVQLIPESQGSYNLMTGVLPAYRGRKIALALKLHAIRYARSSGARHMRTQNDSDNAPMLAVNRKLGYQPQPGKYILEKK